MSGTIVWFRRDLRLADNPALNAALRRGGPVVPVFVRDELVGREWPVGVRARAWLEGSLASLDAALRKRGSRLVILEGDSVGALRRSALSTGADAVFWNERYEPESLARDGSVRAALSEAGIATQTFEGALLHDPHAVRNRQDRPFQVFTPFWRHCSSLPIAMPTRPPSQVFPAPQKWPASRGPAAGAFISRPSAAGGAWEPGEAAATRRLRAFVGKSMEAYAESRDFPAIDGTSRLSPHLAFGEITPRQIRAAIVARSRSSGVFPPDKGAAVFLNEIGWREFAYHVLVNFPHTPRKPLRVNFERFAWADDPGGHRWRAWTEGRTGYPIVDAGMRQLLATGWMHNRVRMITASFLVKHLRLPWTRGAEWFWENLVDADLANNTLGWQWSAGCGADAAPYFRIFAPVAQGRKFDGAGKYVRTWVPELAKVPDAFVHCPWTAPAAVLDAAGVRLGTHYPFPVVEHARARDEALAAFRSLSR